MPSALLIVVILLVVAGLYGMKRAGKGAWGGGPLTGG